jgi:hypothetical protein
MAGVSTVLGDLGDNWTVATKASMWVAGGGIGTTWSAAAVTVTVTTWTVGGGIATATKWVGEHCMIVTVGTWTVGAIIAAVMTWTVGVNTVAVMTGTSCLSPGRGMDAHA